MNADLVNQAFDNYLRAFEVLAEKEDYLELLRAEVNDFKEGTAKALAAQQAVINYEKGMVQYQRELRKAALELDRVKTLVSLASV